MDKKKTAYIIMKSTMVKNPFAKNYYCSNCGYEPAECDNYCPHCGSKFLGFRTEEEYAREKEKI